MPIKEKRMRKIIGLVFAVLLCAVALVSAAESTKYRVIFDSRTGEVLLDTNVTSGDMIEMPWTRIQSHGPAVYYYYRWRRIAGTDSDVEIVESSDCKVSGCVSEKGKIIVKGNLRYVEERTSFLHYHVQFSEPRYFGGKVLLDTLIEESGTLDPPKSPTHKGLYFISWDQDFSMITGPTTIYPIYAAKSSPKYSFTIQNFDYGSKVGDVKITGPNSCFEFSKKIIERDANQQDKEVESVSERENHYIDVTVMVSCVDDSLGNIWNNLMRKHGEENEKVTVSVNGKDKEITTSAWKGHFWYWIIPVTFVDYDGTVLKREFVQEFGSATAPNDPVREGYVFKGWDKDIRDIYTKTTVTAVYEEIESSSSVASSSSVKSSSSVASSSSAKSSSSTGLPKIAFSVTGVELGGTAKDVKIKTPNDCFVASNVKLRQNQREVADISEFDSGFLTADMAVSDTGRCKDDELAEEWRFYANSSEGAVIYTINGTPAHSKVATFEQRMLATFYRVLFKGYSGDTLKASLVVQGLSVTPPEAPKREGYVFEGWSENSLDCVGMDVFDHVTDNMTLVAKYEEVESSSSADVESSSSSSEKAESSSSKSKSSSSKGDAIPMISQVPQFMLSTVDRDIQVVGARVGSVYAVLDLQGRVIKLGRVQSANFNVPMSRAATYLVRVGDQTQSVTIK